MRSIADVSDCSLHVLTRDYSVYLIKDIGLRASVIDQQGVSIPPKHLIPPLVFPGIVRLFALLSILYSMWVLRLICCLFSPFHSAFVSNEIHF